MADLSELQTLLAVARAGSFATAARRLSLSPAMVGRRIQALEQRYGAKLIERTTRSHRLTALGTEFVRKAADILAAVDELGELTKPDEDQLAGRIRLTGPTTLGIKRLTPIISDMTKSHPALRIELQLSDRNVDLVKEGFDLAVRIGQLPSSSMIARRVGTYEFVCCGAPGYLEMHGTPQTPADLRDARCILNLNLVPRDRWPFHGAGGQAFDVEVAGSLEIDNGEALRAAALEGAGLIYSPRDLVSGDLADGALVQVLGDWRTMTLPIHTVHVSRNLVPRRVVALIESIARGLRT